MKNNYTAEIITFLKRPLLIVKLIAALFICGNFQAIAGVNAQNITLTVRNAEIGKVLDNIEKQSDYRFLFNSRLKELKQKVTVSFNNVALNEALEQLFAGTSLTYKQMENNLVAINASASIVQDIPVTGRVTGINNEALSNVSVALKGTQTGTTTDASGNFSIAVPNESSVLIFSYVGYGSQEVTVGNRTTINISLTTTGAQLSEVVVTGYGTQRRRDLTGSVASVKGAEIAKQPVLTATQAIQGRVAGVQIISSGAPNELPTVRIRGTGTMLGGANPLYVVDGVITEDIRNINSADIVSLDILKDASATAIYGMRAANGVLIITTKKGRVGKMVIAYDANIGIREISKLVNMASARQYANYVNEASVFYGSGDSSVTAAQLAAGANTDWYDEILRRGFQQNHNISLSGGSDKINYFLSAGFITDEGIILTNKFNRFTLRSNNEYKFTNNLKLSTLISYSRADLRDVNLDAFNIAYRAAPYVAAKVGDKYGNTSISNNVGNPILNLEKNDNRGLDNRLQGTFAIDFKPITWLALRSSVGVDLDFFKNTSYGYKFANVGDNSVFINNGGNQLRDRSSLGVTRNEATRWVWDNTATITKSFDKHNFTLLLGTTAEEYRFNGVSGSRLDVPENRDQWYLNAGTPTGASNSNDGDKFSRNSYLSRLNYNFDDRYLLTATIRADGTSRFSSKNRWGYFPSVGVAWNIAREAFMDDQKTFNNLKLRGSWGRVGNDQIPTNVYFPIAAINIPYVFNGVEYLGISFNQLPDKNVKWETTEEFDLGLDFSILNSRLNAEIDYYDKKTKDALVNINIPGILGDIDSRYTTNAANFSNRGIELGLNWTENINKDWHYNIGGNIAYNKNKIINLNGGQALFAGGVGGNQGNITKSDNGQPIGSFFILQADGIFQTPEEIAASAQKDAKPGDLRYKDINGPNNDGKPDGKIDANDRAYSGSYQPKITYGINGGVNFKSLDFSVNTYGTSGGKIYNGKKAARVDSRDNLETEVAKNRWTPNNRNTGVPRANLNQLPASTYFLEDGDFFRINNLTLGYTLPKSTLGRFKMQNLRVYFTTQNLATITNYSGFTPEINSGGTLAGGIELGIYPTTRTFAFGVNVGF